jgi:hypothetical protein
MQASRSCPSHRRHKAFSSINMMLKVTHPMSHLWIWISKDQANRISGRFKLKLHGDGILPVVQLKASVLVYWIVSIRGSK